MSPKNIRRLYAVQMRLQGLYWDQPDNRQWIGESLTDLTYVISCELDALHEKMVERRRAAGEENPDDPDRFS